MRRDPIRKTVAVISPLAELYFLDTQDRLFRVAKRQPQTSRKQRFISFDSGWRIANKIVIQTELPAEPLADRGGRDGVERIAVAAGPAEVRKIIECFAESRAAAELRVKLLSSIGFRISLRDSREGRSRRWRRWGLARYTTRKIPGCIRTHQRCRTACSRFDHVTSNTTVDHILKIQILECIGVKIRRCKRKPPRTEIEIAAYTACDLVRNHLAR